MTESSLARTTDRWEVQIEGEPETWGVGNVHAAGSRAKLKSFQHKALVEWRRRHQALKIRGPIALDFLFVTKDPRKDWTNFAKALEDALKHEAFGDDCMVYEAHVRKEPAAGVGYCKIAVMRYRGGPVFEQHTGDGPKKPLPRGFRTSKRAHARRKPPFVEVAPRREEIPA